MTARAGRSTKTTCAHVHTRIRARTHADTHWHAHTQACASPRPAERRHSSGNEARTALARVTAHSTESCLQWLARPSAHRDFAAYLLARVLAYVRARMHARTHARRHAGMHARTHARTQSPIGGEDHEDEPISPGDGRVWVVWLVNYKYPCLRWTSFRFFFFKRIQSTTCWRSVENAASTAAV